MPKCSNRISPLPDLTVSISIKDLMAANRTLINETKEELKRTITESKQELLDQRAHQHKVFIRIVIAIPTAALLILFSSHYLHYRNSAVYWGNRAYNAAKAAGATNPGSYYQYVQEHFQDSLKQTARTNIRRLENTRSISQE